MIQGIIFDHIDDIWHLGKFIKVIEKKLYVLCMYVYYLHAWIVLLCFITIERVICQHKVMVFIIHILLITYIPLTSQNMDSFIDIDITTVV